jgi:hypothetical protein
MIARIKHDYSQIDVIGRQLRVHCQEFGRNPRDIPKSHSALHRIRELIEFIPMASNDFAVAVSRINNARRYLESAEFGAAKYEIRLLLGVLKQSLGRDGVDVTSPQTEIELLNPPVEFLERGSVLR